MSQTVDIGSLVNSGMGVSINSSQKEDPKDARIRRFKDITLFLTTLFMFIFIFGFCSFVIAT